MAVILLIHGPNLNRLGERDGRHYGAKKLSDIEASVKRSAGSFGYDVKTFQSNHEGALIDYIQKECPSAKGIIINPGALTHYSYSLYDALVDSRLPVAEVHLSDINSREPWRKVSVTAPACIAQISGKKEAGYIEALGVLDEHIKSSLQ